MTMPAEHDIVVLLVHVTIKVIPHASTCRAEIILTTQAIATHLLYVSFFVDT